MVLSYFDFTRIVFYRERLKSFSQDVKMHYRLSVKSYNHVQLDGKLVKVEIGGMNISLGLHGANGNITNFNQVPRRYALWLFNVLICLDAAVCESQ